MPDICDLILDDHERLRRRFAELDRARGVAGGSTGADGDGGPDALERIWRPLAQLLDLHAAAEEAVFYPSLLQRGSRGEEETDDAIGDHNQIRDAVHRAAGERPGSDRWWQAVSDAREANSQHMAEEERGAIADFRSNAEQSVRDELGSSFAEFETAHAGMRGIEARDEDPQAYIAEHRG